MMSSEEDVGAEDHCAEGAADILESSVVADTEAVSPNELMEKEAEDVIKDEDEEEMNEEESEVLNEENEEEDEEEEETEEDRSLRGTERSNNGENVEEANVEVKEFNEVMNDDENIEDEDETIFSEVTGADEVVSPTVSQNKDSGTHFAASNDSSANDLRKYSERKEEKEVTERSKTNSVNDSEERAGNEPQNDVASMANISDDYMDNDTIQNREDIETSHRNGNDDTGVAVVELNTEDKPSDEFTARTNHSSADINTAGEEQDNGAAVTLRLLLEPTQQITTVRSNLHQTVSQLKQHFATELKMSAQNLNILMDGRELDDSLSLSSLGVGPNGTLQLEMRSSDPVNHPIQQLATRQEYHMPDVITVRIPLVDKKNSYRNIVVEVTRPTRHKPFLGGYRHKQTGVEYHHAACQTIPKPRPPSGTVQFCRDTQTAELKSLGQQTTVVTSTQMSRPGVHVSVTGDRLLAPRQYVTAEEREQLINDKAIVLQKYWRSWLARQCLARLKEVERQRELWREREEERRKRGKEDRMRWELMRRSNPRSQADFDLLYHALEQWRQEELDRINSTLSGAERKAALCMLLDEEAELIGTITRLQNEANMENRNKIIEDFLSKTAESKRWRGPDGKMTEMDTPGTLRAGQLKDIYHSLHLNNLTQDERLDVLLSIKQTVKEHDCRLTKDIIELIDREADLLMRGVADSNLDGLRKRISTLFLQYIKTPLFNPEAAKTLPIPENARTLRGDIYFCPSCNRYLPSSDFQFSSNSSTVGRCRKCMQRTNDALPRNDFGRYKNMLAAIRRAEEEQEEEQEEERGKEGGSVKHVKPTAERSSKISCLMQEGDIRFLVESIWGGRSALSASVDTHDLVLVRWCVAEEWSPWNCILLTEHEAATHRTINNLEEIYGVEFVQRVKHRQSLARNHFARIPAMSVYMRRRLGSATAKPILPSSVSTRRGPLAQAAN